MRRHIKPKADLGTLRIIGGKHRGRKLSFPLLEGVRPTPDRVRETLFNWLAPYTPGARCLDLFAGSGALGLEAISRDAGAVCFVDAAGAIVQSLRQQLEILKDESAQVIRGDALQWLQLNRPDAPFDLIFLDPPFHKGLLAPVCEALAAGGFLHDRSRIYLEAEVSLNPLPIPSSWQIYRHKKAGQVQYALCLASDSE